MRSSSHSFQRLKEFVCLCGCECGCRIAVSWKVPVVWNTRMYQVTGTCDDSRVTLLGDFHRRNSARNNHSDICDGCLNSGHIQRVLHARSPISMSSPIIIPAQKRASLWTADQTSPKPLVAGSTPVPRRIKLGLLSSDFGVHPVATLLRGMIQYINKTEIEVRVATTRVAVCACAQHKSLVIEFAPCIPTAILLLLSPQGTKL